MAKVCFPSILYGCRLHCFDTEDESLGDWYEPNPACAISVNPSEIEGMIMKAVRNPKDRTINRAKLSSFINSQLSGYRQLEAVLSGGNTALHQCGCASHTIVGKYGRKYMPS